MIQFACPTCKATCSVDDKLAGRKIKCPKCGARVVHVKDGHVELLSAGSPASAKATAGAPVPAKPGAAVPGAPVPDDRTPLATAAVPHSVGEFVQQSESRQNLYIAGGLVLVFAAILTVLGIVLDLRLLAVAPIAVVLSLAAAGLWLHTQKLKRRIAERQKLHETPKT